MIEAIALAMSLSRAIECTAITASAMTLLENLQERGIAESDPGLNIQLTLHYEEVARYAYDAGATAEQGKAAVIEVINEVQIDMRDNGAKQAWENLVDRMMPCLEELEATR